MSHISLDDKFCSLLKVVTKVWCYVTGTSNYTFAKLLAMLPTPLFVVIITAVPGAHQSIPVFAFDVLATIVVTGLILRSIHSIEKTRPQYKSAIPAEVLLLRSFRRQLVKLLTPFMLILLLICPPMISVLVLLILPLYVAEHYDQGGKSIWSHLKNGLTNLSDALSSLGPTPALAPIPVRNRQR